MKKAAITAVVLLSSSVALADSAQELWTSRCKSCHAEDGSGKTKIGQKEGAADMGAADWQSSRSDAQIRTVITDGSTKSTKMKSFKDKLSGGDIDGLVKLIRSLKK